MFVAITQPVGIDADTAEEFVAYAARVSNPANQGNHGTASRLLAYLRRNKHWSPFEMADATIEITTTRDIARQMLRHRSFSFQEFSQRYAEAPGMTIVKEARRQDLKNRQNSIRDLPRWKRMIWSAVLRLLAAFSNGAYRLALRLGIAKECAHVLLPEGLTISRMFMKASFRS